MMVAQEKLKKVVGAGNMSSEHAMLDEYSSDMSFVNQVRPACVIKPKKAKDIQKIINIANKTHTPLVPVSSGAPHFRGDTVPCDGGSVVVDLNQMKKVIFVDRPRRVAMIEPGVTFKELIPLVKKEGLRLNMPLLPRKSKSVIGSILEREPVLMPGYQWDISDPLACAGLCFGNGEEFRTGQAAGPGTVEEQWKVGGVQKAPYGPGTASLHRLIQGSQGTMGIVTWASLRCELLPSVEAPFLVGSSEFEKVLELSHWLVRLRMVTECFILNSTSLAAVFAKKAGDYQNIKDSLPAYILFYTLAGYNYFPEERISSNIADITKITQRLGLDPVKSVGAVSANEMLKTVQQPSEEPFWKLRYKGACQEIFFLSIHQKLEGQIKAMKDMADKAAYPVSDLGIYIQPIVQGTGYHCEFNMFYDPENPIEVNRVKDLSPTAIKNLMNKGAFFSRPYGDEAKSILNRDSATTNALHRLKKIFDPNNIMNPGKVCF
ncbi:FAD-binding oxidoreductase [Thermodesulfobacteriota bacterium]